jgi:hypothetical protein
MFFIWIWVDINIGYLSGAFEGDRMLPPIRSLGLSGIGDDSDRLTTQLTKQFHLSSPKNHWSIYSPIWSNLGAELNPELKGELAARWENCGGHPDYILKTLQDGNRHICTHNGRPAVISESILNLVRR